MTAQDISTHVTTLHTEINTTSSSSLDGRTGEIVNCLCALKDFGRYLTWSHSLDNKATQFQQMKSSSESTTKLGIVQIALATKT